MNVVYMAVSIILGVGFAVLFAKYDCRCGQIKMVNAETSVSEVDFVCRNIFEITN